MKKKAVALLLSLCLLALCGCATPAGTSSKPIGEDNSHLVDSKPDSDFYRTEWISDSEYQQISDFIDEQNVVSLIEPYMSGFRYYHAREQADAISSLGLKSLPIIIDKLAYEPIKEPRYNMYLCEIICAIWRINHLKSDYEQFETSYEIGVICNHYLCSKKEIVNIIRKNIDSADKILKLREYGILAIPYVVEEIDKGNTEYEAFFTAIGLHMDVPRYMEFMSNFELPDEERYEAEGFMDGAESFDYKVWLSENEKDLENLFKYLDAYCAEYEARQGK